MGIPAYTMSVDSLSGIHFPFEDLGIRVNTFALARSDASTRAQYFDSQVIRYGSLTIDVNVVAAESASPISNPDTQVAVTIWWKGKANETLAEVAERVLLSSGAKGVGGTLSSESLYIVPDGTQFAQVIRCVSGFRESDCFSIADTRDEFGAQVLSFPYLLGHSQVADVSYDFYLSRGISPVTHALQNTIAVRNASTRYRTHSKFPNDFDDAFQTFFAEPLRPLVKMPTK